MKSDPNQLPSNTKREGDRSMEGIKMNMKKVHGTWRESKGNKKRRGSMKEVNEHKVSNIDMERAVKTWRG